MSKVAISGASRRISTLLKRKDFETRVKNNGDFAWDLLNKVVEQTTTNIAKDYTEKVAVVAEHALGAQSILVVQPPGSVTVQSQRGLFPITSGSQFQNSFGNTAASGVQSTSGVFGQASIPTPLKFCNTCGQNRPF